MFQCAEFAQKWRRKRKDKGIKRGKRKAGGYYSTVEIRNGTVVKRPLTGDIFRINELEAIAHLDKAGYSDAPKLLSASSNRIKTSRIRGVTLEAEIGRGISPQRQRKIGKSIAGSVQRLHAAGVSHGDLHPGNIMVSRRGKAKLLDYGYASVGDAPSINMFDYKYLVSKTKSPDLRILRKEISRGVVTEGLMRKGVRILRR